MRQIAGWVGTWVTALVLIGGCAKAPADSGAELFATHCASCHGRYGEGDGPMAADLGRSIPDLRYLAARNGGSFPQDRVTAIIDGREIIKGHSDRQMPVWGDVFVELEGANNSSKAQAQAKIRALVDYLATIQQSP